MSKKLLILLPALVLFLATAVQAEYREREEADPIVKAILWGASNARALVDYDQMRFHVGKGMRIDNEWSVEDIRRDSVLFRKKSTRMFVEIPLETKDKATYHRDWSFWGTPLGLWESIEMLAQGFGFNAVMHYQSTGTVLPRCHSDRIENFIIKILPKHHRFLVVDSLLMVLPVRPADEDWSKVFHRLKEFRPVSLLQRFPGLAKEGSLCSRGDDIQTVLRQISLGSGVRFQIPRDVHFPVYATFSKVPFLQIVSKIIYLNQCFMIERDICIEIQPWPRHLIPMPVPPAPEMAVTSPDEPQDGWGRPTTPPVYSGELPPFVEEPKQKPAFIRRKSTGKGTDSF